LKEISKRQGLTPYVEHVWKYLSLNCAVCLLLHDHHLINLTGIVPNKLDALISSNCMSRAVFRKWKSG